MPLIGTRGAASAQGFGEFARQASVVQAEAIDFDGTNDYLSRSSDLVGNTDGKTFTFSAWVWINSATSNQTIYVCDDGTDYGFLVRSSLNQIRFLGVNSAGTQILAIYAPTSSLPQNTFVNVLFSINLGTTQWKMYLNDQQVTTVDTAYANDSIDFTRANHRVARHLLAGYWGGRLSNVYLDYTYRDLSVTANRRLFITADLKPASGQAALNPILYLPMSDPTQPGLNAGTGGNFTLTGTVARSGRGPNQYNVPYTQTPGLMSRAALTGIASGKQFTIAFTIRKHTATSGFDEVIAGFYVGDGSGARLQFSISDPAQNFRISANNSSGTPVLSVNSGLTLVTGRNYNVVMSVDLTSTAKRFIYVDGVDVTSTSTWNTYVNDNIDFTGSAYCTVAAQTSFNTNANLKAQLGGLWFNTSYIDLSVAANLAKFVTGTGINAQPVDPGATGQLPTGTSPLVYMPMYANNNGKNYGTGGDYSNGGTTGARGPNEFWGNKAKFDGSTGYLSAASYPYTGVPNSKVVSFCFFIERDSVGTTQYILDVSGGPYFQVWLDASNQFNVIGKNASNTTILSFTSANTFASTGTKYFIYFYADLTNSSNRGFGYTSDGVNWFGSGSWATYTNDTIAFNATTNYLFGRAGATGNNLAGKLSQFYFTTQYVPISAGNVTSFKFIDAFGNPVNLGLTGDTPTGVPPEIYLRFPPTSFGTNSGTGGNFTVNGTITDGGQL